MLEDRLKAAQVIGRQEWLQALRLLLSALGTLPLHPVIHIGHVRIIHPHILLIYLIPHRPIATHTWSPDWAHNVSWVWAAEHLSIWLLLIDGHIVLSVEPRLPNTVDFPVLLIRAHTAVSSEYVVVVVRFWLVEISRIICKIITTVIGLRHIILLLIVIVLMFSIEVVELWGWITCVSVTLTTAAWTLHAVIAHELVRWGRLALPHLLVHIESCWVGLIAHIVGEHLLVLEMPHLHVLLKVYYILVLLKVLLALESLGGHLAVVLWELTLSHIRHELRIHIVIKILWNILAMSWVLTHLRSHVQHVACRLLERLILKTSLIVLIRLASLLIENIVLVVVKLLMVRLPLLVRLQSFFEVLTWHLAFLKAKHYQRINNRNRKRTTSIYCLIGVR